MDNVRSLDLDIKTNKCSVMYVLQRSSELSFSALCMESEDVLGFIQEPEQRTINR